MHEAVPITISAVTGAAVGVFHFGLLWLTVRRIPGSPRPGRLMLAGALFRFAVCIAGFVAVAHYAGVGGVLAALAAFLAVRVSIVRRIRRAAGATDAVGMEE